MKKLLACLLSAILVFSMAATSITLPVSAEGFALRAGDVDSDHSITTADARDTLSYTLSLVSLDANEKIAADYDFNGVVNTSDARMILQSTVSEDPNVLKSFDLLGTSAEEWLSPVQTTSGVPSIVSVSEGSVMGKVFTNVGGTWPYAAYAYEQKLLVPDDAYIEYDLTVGSSATSINFYVGGSTPDMEGDKYMDDVAGRQYFKLNSYISSTKIDPGSGDLLSGTYRGKVMVGDLDLPDNCRIDGMVWISGLKVYAVGNNASTVTIRKLTVTGYRDPLLIPQATDPLEKVRPSLVNDAETEGLTTLTGLEMYVNGVRTADSTIGTTTDNKKIYNTNLYRRVVNYTDGYQMDIPFDWQEDYSLAELRTRYESEHYALTVSYETKSPYGNTASGWNTYLTEWLNRYIADSSFLSANNLAYARNPVTSTTLVSGFEVLLYDILIKDNANIDLPYYSIAIVRKANVYNRFYLFVLKSDAPTYTVMEKLLRSFKTVAQSGTPVNTQGEYKLTMPTNWSTETKSYFNKLQTQNSTDWGFFSASMVSKSDSSYSSQGNKIKSEYNRISAAINYDYEIMPTYTHLLYGSNYNQFPTDHANTYAGGNGFNGKPVLQFTYQFTSSNNTNLAGATPMYDIMRGKHDAQFRKLAKDIKAYGKPVLFRLNNEMNTDWTSYCGMVTLLDPDIFIATWERLYTIFAEEGVNNCIWIFNPLGTTTPYSGWGEELCYMPDPSMVHIYGLTNYEMGNESTLKSFRTMYTNTYNKSDKYFGNRPWVISEFGAGAGGAKKYDWGVDGWIDTTLGRNGAQQTAWVNSMFDCFKNRDLPENAFCDNIKGAVWFSVNDYTKINSTNYITNYFELDSSRSATLNAFRNGLNS